MAHGLDHFDGNDAVVGSLQVSVILLQESPGPPSHLANDLFGVIVLLLGDGGAGPFRPVVSIKRLAKPPNHNRFQVRSARP